MSSKTQISSQAEFEQLDPADQSDLIKLSKMLRQARALGLADPSDCEGFTPVRYLIPAETAEDLGLPLALVLDENGKTWCNGQLKSKRGVPVDEKGETIVGVRVEMPSGRTVLSLVEMLAATGSLMPWLREEPPGASMVFDLQPGTATLNGSAFQIEIE